MSSRDSSRFRSENGFATLELKPDLRSENKNVCVMFLDIRNFTGFAEKRSPEEVVQYLESLFEFMI